MSRGRPPLPVGTFGSISVREVGPKRFRARARFRDFDGQVREVVKFGETPAGAQRNLRAALVERVEEKRGTDISRATKVAELAAAWLEEVKDSDRLAGSTKARYTTIVESFIVPGVGALRVGELTVAAVDRHLRAITERHGGATAKAVRSCLSGMVGLAMRHGTLATNPTRDARDIPVPRKVARALTVEELSEILANIGKDPEAIRLDLVDLVAFMAGTGVRIGEACALRLPQVDLDGGTVEISATVTDLGLEERTKTAAGWRVIAVPKDLVDIIRRRKEGGRVNSDGVVFPSPIGRVRDSSNTAGDLRRTFDAAGYSWVSSHTFRKTVATLLDEAGFSARQIADHLGHAQPSMTQDVYMGRRMVNSRAADVLSRSFLTVSSVTPSGDVQGAERHGDRRTDKRGLNGD
jgi:integrase